MKTMFILSALGSTVFGVAWSTGAMESGPTPEQIIADGARPRPGAYSGLTKMRGPVLHVFPWDGTWEPTVMDGEPVLARPCPQHPWCNDPRHVRVPPLPRP